MAKGKKKANSEAPPGLGNNGGGDRAEAIRNACQRLAQGLDAGLAGRNRESNPYEEGAPEHLKWDAGWVGGQRQNVARMAGSTEAAPAH